MLVSFLAGIRPARLLLPLSRLWLCRRPLGRLLFARLLRR
jgi:hypothetical protein